MKYRQFYRNRDYGKPVRVGRVHNFFLNIAKWIGISL